MAESPDVEGLFVRLISGVGVPVSSKVPRDRPDTFVRVSLTGCNGGRFLDEPTVLVECWAPDTVTASELARSVRQRLHETRFDVVDGWQVYGIGCAYPAYHPDEVSDRYQFLANIRLRRHN